MRVGPAVEQQHRRPAALVVRPRARSRSPRSASRHLPHAVRRSRPTPPCSAPATAEPRRRARWRPSCRPAEDVDAPGEQLRPRSSPRAARRDRAAPQPSAPARGSTPGPPWCTRPGDLGLDLRPPVAVERERVGHERLDPRALAALHRRASSLDRRCRHRAGRRGGRPRASRRSTRRGRSTGWCTPPSHRRRRSPVGAVAGSKRRTRSSILAITSIPATGSASIQWATSG